MFSLQHFNNFGLLLAGRLVGGIATSILCSNFESWLVCEHHKVSSTLYFHLLTTQCAVFVCDLFVVQLHGVSFPWRGALSCLFSVLLLKFPTYMLAAV